MKVGRNIISFALISATAATGSTWAAPPQKIPVTPHTTIAAPLPASRHPSSLHADNGNAERGKAVFVDRATGHCLLCHSVQSLDEPSQGNIGPPLDAVASRLSETELRKRLVDSTKINPDSAMPAYYRQTGLTQVASEYAGKPVLTAQQVEDVLAYLLTLKETSGE